MDRLTTEEMLVARINRIERMLETTLLWTGLDEDWTSLSETPTLHDVVSAQGIVITHLLRLLEEKVPDFKIKSVRERMLLVNEIGREERAATFDGPSELFEELEERWRRVMTDLLPVSIYDRPERQATRPYLVRSAPETPGTEDE